MSTLTLKEILLKSAEYLERKWQAMTPPPLEGVGGREIGNNTSVKINPHPDPLQRRGGNARYEAELILSHYLNISRMDLYLEFERVIEEDKASMIRNAMVERGKRKPLQYILGSVQFLDCEIEVNEDVLIPRPETEYMVDTIRNSECGMRNEIPPNPLSPIGNRHYKRGEYTILDLCTGSGAIAIALKKKYTDAVVYATDVCDKALDVAKRNADKNGCEIVFMQSDLFEKLVGADLCVCPNTKSEHAGSPLPIRYKGDWKSPLRIFDIIVCNPPYISEDEYKSLEPELFFEPKLALIADKNGLYFYEKILKEAKGFMKDDGLLYLEIGSEQADDIVKLAIENGYTEYNIIKDLSERNRIVRIKK
jgi:release factor glutamine methyltransferase